MVGRFHMFMNTEQANARSLHTAVLQPASHHALEQQGMKAHVLQELQRALEHRHKLLAGWQGSLNKQWGQLEQVLAASSPQVHSSTTILQLLLDIDQTLLYSRSLDTVFDTVEGTGKFDDPDMQHFFALGEAFFKWADQAYCAHRTGKPWPTWLPSAAIGGRTYSMWFPQPDPRDPQDPHPIPEFMTPVFDATGCLTHYILLFGSLNWQLQEGGMDGQAGKRSMGEVSQFMTVVPAEITVLTYLRYSLAGDVDKLRPVPAQEGDATAAGHTEVELRLASCGSEGYVNRLWRLLEQLLGCSTNAIAKSAGMCQLCTAPVFADKASFPHDGTFQGCIGAKSLSPFNLRESAGGIICPRLVIDDHIIMWGVDEARDQLKLLPVNPWKGRWHITPDYDIDNEAGNNVDNSTTTQLQPAEQQEGSRGCSDAGDTAGSSGGTVGSSVSSCGGDGDASGQKGQCVGDDDNLQPDSQDPAAARLSGQLSGQKPEGLVRVLPEVLALLVEALKGAEGKVVPATPAALAITAAQTAAAAAPDTIKQQENVPAAAAAAAPTPPTPAKALKDSAPSLAEAAAVCHTVSGLGCAPLLPQNPATAAGAGAQAGTGGSSSSAVGDKVFSTAPVAVAGNNSSPIMERKRMRTCDGGSGGDNDGLPASKVVRVTAMSDG